MSKAYNPKTGRYEVEREQFDDLAEKRLKGRASFEAQVEKIGHQQAEPGADERAAWFAVVMEAAATLEIVGDCTRDEDAKRQAIGAATYARKRAKVLLASQRAGLSLGIVEAKKRAIEFADRTMFADQDFRKVAMYAFDLGMRAAAQPGQRAGMADGFHNRLWKLVENYADDVALYNEAVRADAGVAEAGDACLDAERKLRALIETIPTQQQEGGKN